MTPRPRLAAVADAPEDTITRLRFIDDGGGSYYLLAASWDCCVRLYAVGEPAADASAAAAAAADGANDATPASADLAALSRLDAPVLDACFVGGDGNPATIAAGLVGGAVELIDLQAGGVPTTRLGATDALGAAAGASPSPPPAAPLAAGARCVEWLGERGLVVAAGWDSTLRLFDPRARPGAAQVARCALPAKALAACVLPGAGGGAATGDERVAVATAGCHVWTYSARSLCDGAPPLERAQTALKGQVRALAYCVQGGVAAAAGVEGKVAVFGGGRGRGPGGAGAVAGAVEPFAFKCHRGSSNNATLANPVHCVAFHPRTGALLTGGGDGSVASWDVGSKKRLAALQASPAAAAPPGDSLSPGEEVVALAVADGAGGCGALVAVGLGSAVGRDLGRAADSLVLARLAEAEVAPRQRHR